MSLASFVSASSEFIFIYHNPDLIICTLLTPELYDLSVDAP